MIRSLSRDVLTETKILAAVGCLDLLTSVYFLATGMAYEANPLMASILEHMGPRNFVTAKALLLGAPLVIAEMARRRRPFFVRAALRLCIVLYACMLAIAYLRGGFITR
jgi:hypothetical protein